MTQDLLRISPPFKFIKIEELSFEGHIGEVPGACLFRPDSGGCWGLRFPGGQQWHVGYDPVTVETCFRAAAALSRGQGRRTGQEMNLQCGAIRALCAV